MLQSDFHVTHLNKLTFRLKHNASLSSPAFICIYWRIHSVPLWPFLCPHSLVLVPFHFCLILSLFFFFFFYIALTSLLTKCYYSEQKQTRALFTRSNTFHSAQLRFAGEHALPYSATLSGAKWRYLVGRSACPARWHADVMWDMLTWLMSDRDDARKNCFTTHHYHVTPRDVS